MTEPAKRGRPRKERYALLMGGFWRNDKVRRLSLEACAVLTKAWSYAADQLTDGHVPIELLRAWCGDEKRYRRVIAELTRLDPKTAHPFLSIAEGEIDAVAHDWHEVNISVADWEATLAAERQRKSTRKPSEFPGGNGAGKAPGNPHSNKEGNPAAVPPPFRPAALDEDEDEEKRDLPREAPGDLVARAPVSGAPAPPAASPAPSVDPPGPTDSERIAALSKRYPPDLVAAVYDGVRRTRRTAKISDSAWRAVLDRLDAFALDVVVAAMRIYVDKYADGTKGESYLLGIVRGERERGPGPSRARGPGPMPPPATNDDFEDGRDPWELR